MAKVMIRDSGDLENGDCCAECSSRMVCWLNSCLMSQELSKFRVEDRVTFGLEKRPSSWLHQDLDLRGIILLDLVFFLIEVVFFTHVIQNPTALAATLLCIKVW